MEGRLICRNEADWEVQRRAAYDRAKGLCEGFRGRRRCGREAPLHDVKGPDGIVERRAGHAHHKEKRKVRDDRAEMLEWLCWECHDVEERGPKAVPAKEKDDEAQRGTS